jgi:hypothetical protein
MVADDVLRVVDHTTPIAGEQATGMNGVEITPRVDTVAAWHDTSLSLASPGSAGERRIPHRSWSVAGVGMLPSGGQRGRRHASVDARTNGSDVGERRERGDIETQVGRV